MELTKLFADRAVSGLLAMGCVSAKVFQTDTACGPALGVAVSVG
jgi:hypothetical protein